MAADRTTRMTPKRAGRAAREGSVFLSDAVAANLRAERARRQVTQDEVAARMRGLGHGSWTRATVSEVERAGRTITLDEFFGLALALGVSPGGLLSVHGARVDLGGPANPVPAGFVALWLSGRFRAAVDPDHPESFVIEPADGDPAGEPAGVADLRARFGDRVRYTGDAR